MMKCLTVLLCMCSLMLFLAGCDKSPKNLGPEYHKGKCIVCKRNTMVRDTVMNPITDYKISCCWREECARPFAVNPNEYADKSKLPSPEDMQKFLSGIGMNAPGKPTIENK